MTHIGVRVATVKFILRVSFNIYMTDVNFMWTFCVRTQSNFAICMLSGIFIRLLKLVTVLTVQPSKTAINRSIDHTRDRDVTHILCKVSCFIIIIIIIIIIEIL